ncbi:glycosyltransferase family 87 protein [Nocardiopsis sediminis]|uniref:Glycosyltransferase family 87 protein n=1 Tax=Nocardiopsis sediminis TaxID=1778267 RepID=A0ABV8FPS7_9ACTN
MPWTALTAFAVIGAALGYLAKAPCRFGGAWLYGGQYEAGCYSDVFPLYYRDGLDDGVVPYLEREIEYPVLTGGLMHLLGRAVAWLPDRTARAYAYFDATALVMAGCLVAVVLCTGYLAGRGGILPGPAGRPFDRRAALLAGGFTALVPAAMLAAYINWDLLAVALLMGGLAAYARGRQWAGGALIGLATAAKFYPFLVFGPLFVLVVRAWWRKEPGPGPGDLLRPLGGAVAAWSAVNVPVLLAAPDGWATFFRFSSERGADWGSPYYLLGSLGLFDYADTDLVNATGTVSLAVACALVAALGVFARRRPPMEQLVFLVVAAFLITNKVWSPQFVLWLLPLAALAWPRRLPVWAGAVAFGLWQLAEVGYFFGIWQHLLHQNLAVEGVVGGLPFEGYAVVSLARSLTVVTVGALVVVDNLRGGDSTA